MAKKKAPVVEGAPLWVLTFGDLMSLLLCFFVLLAAMANYDDRDKMFMATIESIRKAFGSAGQAGYMPDNIVDFKSFLMRMETMHLPDNKKNLGHSDEPGIDGEFYRVKKVRDGAELIVGGPIAFARFSAEIEPTMDAFLTQLADEIRGKRNKIEIRGHATQEPLPLDSTFPDQIDLGYARARTVRDRLVKLGIDPSAIRVSSAGPYEPLLKQVYSDDRRAANRRVDIILTQALMDDYEAAAQSTEELSRSAEEPAKPVSP